MAETDKILVLFVHGLNGSAKSWGNFEQLLASDVTCAEKTEIAYFVYPTNIWNGWPLHRPVKMTSLVNALFTDIEVKYGRYKRIIIVAHSMGGLIARRYLANHFAKESRSRVVTLICFATPHTGPELSGAIQYFQSNHDQIKHILAGSDFLLALDGDWERASCARKVQCISVRGGKDVIVGEQSAHGMPESIPYTVAEGDHISLVKPKLNTDTAYLIVSQALNSILKGGNEQLARTRQAIADGDTHSILTLVANNGRSWIETRDSEPARALLEDVLKTSNSESEQYVWAKYLLALDHLFRYEEASATAFPDELITTAAKYGLGDLFVAEKMEFARKSGHLGQALEIFYTIYNKSAAVENAHSSSRLYATGAALFLQANLMRRGGRYNEASDLIDLAKTFYKGTIPSHQIELAHCHYAQSVCYSMTGKPIPESSALLIGQDYRLFSAALFMLVDSHREWLRGDAGQAVQRCEAASKAFDAIGFTLYGKRAALLRQYLSIWQKLGLGARVAEVAEEYHEHAATIRGLLGVSDATGILKDKLQKMRPSRAVGLLQFASAYSQCFEDDIGEFELPSVLTLEGNRWTWQTRMVRSLSEADTFLRQAMGIPPNVSVPLLAD